MNLRSCLLGLAAALGVAASANAATVTFDFTAANSGGWANSLAYTNGGVTLTVTGGDTTGGSGKVQTWKNAGLGLKSASDCTLWGICTGVDHQIDSVGRDDIAYFSFSKAVSIASLAFTYVGSGDTFDFYAGGTKIFNAIVGPSVSFASTLGTSFAVGAGVTTWQQCWTVGNGKKATQHCQTNTVNSAFKLAGVTVNVADDPAPVPLPAAGLGLVAALGALGLMRRRKAT
jgi:hypothetical protein